MSNGLTKQLPIALLALCLTSTAVASAQAQSSQYHSTSHTSTTLQISFESSPHWTNVQGMHAQQIRESQRPNYDIFRYKGHYYVYQHNRWYMSRHSQGQYAMIEERQVPGEIYRVPREHWQAYPSDWSDKNYDHHSDHHDNHGSGKDGGKSNVDHK